jgi:hypothetical protein
VSIVVVVVVVVANVVVNVTNVVDFHDCPSNFHKCLHLFVDEPQPLESRYQSVTRTKCLIAMYKVSKSENSENFGPLVKHGPYG